MSKITLDAATAAALQAAEPGTELVGPDGKPVGAFVPRKHSDLLRWVIEERERRLAEAVQRTSLAELQAIEAAGGEIPHEEVIDRLGLR